MKKIIILLLLLIVGCSRQITEKEVIPMKIATPAFDHGKAMPKEYTCDGDNVSPELNIADVPNEAKSLALIMEDPDAPRGIFVHWVMWNIPPNIGTIKKGETRFEQGVNDFGENGYGGPCPPSGTHRYFFKLYALDTELSISKDSGKAELEKAMEGHVLAKAEIMGTYKRG